MNTADNLEFFLGFIMKYVLPPESKKLPILYTLLLYYIKYHPFSRKTTLKESTTCIEFFVFNIVINFLAMKIVP